MGNMMELRLASFKFNILCPIGEVASEPIQGLSSHFLFIKCIKEDFFINGVKDLG